MNNSTCFWARLLLAMGLSLLIGWITVNVINNDDVFRALAYLFLSVVAGTLLAIKMMPEPGN